jgi:hypothetical protein
MQNDEVSVVPDLRYQTGWRLGLSDSVFSSDSYCLLRGQLGKRLPELQRLITH